MSPPRPPARARLLLSLLALLAALGCGPVPVAAPRAPLRELSLPISALLAQVPTEYATTRPVPIPDDRGTAAAQAAFATMIGGAATHEPALDMVAAIAGKSYGETQELPAEALLQWLFWKCGAVSLPGPLNVLVAPAEAEPYFRDQLQKAAAALPRGFSLAYGLARVATQGEVAQVMVLGLRLTELAPIAKSQAPGARVPVRIKPTKAYGELTLYVDQGGPEVVELPMKAEADGSFSGEAPIPGKPGRYFAEVVGVELPPGGAVEKGWRVSLLWLPLYAGVAEPVAPDEFIRHPQKNHPDRATWPAQVLNAYNEARARLGRAPLAFEAGPSNTAQQRSEEIAGTVELPPPDLDLHKKLALAGSPARRLFGFIDEIEYVSEYITLRLQRPAARFAIFDPDVTTFALGLSPRRVSPGLGLINSVEYVFEHIRVDPKKEHDRVQAELDADDRAGGGRGFGASEPLARAAQGVADEVCRGGPEPTDAQAIFARAAGLDPALHHRFAVPWFGYDLSKKEIAHVYDAAKGKGYTQVGVGVCQGTVGGRPGVVMMMALFAGP
jgi:hypothetical protein